MITIEDRIKAAILGLAVGDALGVPVEFSDREKLVKNPVVDLREYGMHRQPRGTWSDDSSLTFCLMESLIKEYDLEDIAINFLDWWQSSFWTPHDSVFDIGITTRQAIGRIAKGVQPELCGGIDVNSNGNGSLMWILPMAFYLFNEEDIAVRFKKVKDVSSITHGHIRSVMGCFIYVEYCRYLLAGKDKFEALTEMQSNVEAYFNQIEIYPEEIELYRRVLSGNISELKVNQISSSGYVLSSLEASLWAFLSTDNYKSAVLKAVNLGDDTDTVGAITGGLAGLYYGSNPALDEWSQQLASIIDIQDLIVRFSAKLSL